MKCFTISLKHLFLACLLIISIILIFSLVGIAINSVHSIGNISTSTLSKSVYKGTTLLYLQKNQQQSKDYNTLFAEANLFSRLIAIEAEDKIKNNDNIIPSLEKEAEKAQYLTVNDNGVLTNSSNSNPRAWFWKDGLPQTPNLKRTLSRLLELQPLLAFTSVYYSEFFDSFISSGEYGFLILCFNDPSVSGKITLPTKDLLKQFYGRSMPEYNHWTSVYRDVTGALVLTVLYHLHDQNARILGRAGIDIDVGKIVNNWNFHNHYGEKEIITEERKNFSSEIPGAFSFILDRDSRIISFPSSYYDNFGLTNPDLNKYDYMQVVDIKMSDSRIQSVRNLIKLFYEQKSGYTLLTIRDKKFVVTYSRIPLTGWVLGTVIPEEGVLSRAHLGDVEINDAVSELAIDFMFIASLSFLLSLALIVYFFKRILLEPIEYLKKKVSLIRGGSFNTDIPGQGTKEIADLASAFNYLGRELDRYTNDLKKKVEEREHIENEVFIAKQIQTSILPNASDFQTDKDFEFYAELVPSQVVAGDFYDFFKMPGGKIAFLIADVAGKGISAAFYMTVAKSVVRDVCLQNPADPAEVLRETNNILTKDYDVDMFVSLFLFYYDVRTGIIQYANAGSHGAILSKKDGTTYEFGELSQPVLGFMPDIIYSISNQYLEPGDMICLYTDGVLDTEQTSTGIDKDELIGLISKNRELSVKDICSGILGSISMKVHGRTSEDMTLLFFKRT